jgi:hypothetical protein
MSKTYIIDEFEVIDKSVKITFVNEEGFIHERYVNIPHLEDGSVDEVYFKQIIDGQLRGVENKEKIGALTFINPDNVGVSTSA